MFRQRRGQDVPISPHFKPVRGSVALLRELDKRQATGLWKQNKRAVIRK